MIQNEEEYKHAKRRVEDNLQTQRNFRTAMASKGYTDEEIEVGMQPILSFHAGLVEEVEYYEKHNISPRLNK